MSPKTKEELAYEKLKQLILSGVLPKDEFLSQRMLARAVDTNITTVRTALRQLESDGLMENIPQWGVRIPSESEERLLDLYFMRELLEVGAVTRLLERRAAVDEERLVALAKRCDTFARDRAESVASYSQSHFDFHMELARQSGSSLLVQSLNRIHFRSILLWHDWRLHRRRSAVNHEELIHTILYGGRQAAVAAIREHVNLGLRNEVSELRKSLDREKGVRVDTSALAARHIVHPTDIP